MSGCYYTRSVSHGRRFRLSELEALCENLSAINGDVLQMAQELYGKAQTYSRASAQAAAAARQSKGEAAAALTRAAAALSAAAQHCGRAAQSLTGASSEGQAFVQRTVGGGGLGGSVGGSVGGSNLSEADRAALSDYTGTGYADMNRALRRQTTMDDNTMRRAEAVSAALSKLPDHSGISYRGTYLSPEQVARYKEGERVTEHGFTSSSNRVDVTFPGNTYFYIQGQHGKYVAPFSNLSGESEVLFDKDTEYFVHAHEIDPSGRHVIILVEI